MRILPAAVPFIVAVLVGLVWINQGHNARYVDAIIVPHDADPAQHPLSIVRRTLLNVYRYPADTQIYFAVANAMRGRPYDHKRLAERGRDTPAYFSRAPAEDGRFHLPYAEVPLEYPPAVLPFVVLPSFFAQSDEAYTRVFGYLMCGLLLAGAVLVIRTQPATARGERWWWMAGMLLALGSLSIHRLDAVLALALAGVFWAAAERRPGQTGAWLGFAAALKFLPVLLAPPLVVGERRELPIGAWKKASVGFLVALAVSFSPVLWAGEGLLDVLAYHSKRGLQVESTYAVVLSTFRLATGQTVRATGAFGSLNLDGQVASFLVHLSTPVTLVLFALITVRLVRAAPPQSEEERRDRLALVLLSGLAAIWLAAKVFSPQYLTWAIPLVLGVSGKRGQALRWIFFAILWVTQMYMTGYYSEIEYQHAAGILTLLARLVPLVAFFVIAFRGLGSAAARRALDQPSFELPPMIADSGAESSSVAAAKSTVTSSR